MQLRSHFLDEQGDLRARETRPGDSLGDATHMIVRRNVSGVSFGSQARPTLPETREKAQDDATREARAG